MKQNYVNLKRYQKSLRTPRLLCCLLLLFSFIAGLTACGAAQDAEASSEPEYVSVQEPESAEVPASAEESTSAEEASAEEDSSQEKTVTEEDSGSGYETATVIASTLNMREKATTDSDVVEQLTMGTKVEVMGAGKYWAKVRTADKKVGFVDVEYLMIGTPDVKSYEILREARKYLGTPYVWGGTSPSGFDCSGFTQYVYIQLGLYLPRIADDQFDMGTPVDIDELQIGDLVFFGSGTYATHVGIYSGAGCFIHASNSGVTTTSLQKPYYAGIYIGARRILEDND